MITAYVREQRRYSQEELRALFICSTDEVVHLIKHLKEYGIVKAVKASDSQRDLSDLSEEDVAVADVEAGSNEYLYVFTFVGVISIAGRILKCYPKYLRKTNEPKVELKQVIKVLEKFNSKEQIVRMYNDSTEGGSFNLLAVLLYLINDYFVNGVYTAEQQIIESNGNGAILWDKTINETFTLIDQGRPYYPELLTHRRISDDYDYIRRLHECLVSAASKELSQADLLDLFDLTEADLTDETLEDFGDNDYILYRIEKELNTQFNTRKRVLLKVMYTYISHQGGLYDIDAFSMFGTNSFNIVWEKICAEVFNNQLDVPIGRLQLPGGLVAPYDAKENETLLSLIDKPLWSESKEPCEAADTLIPDLVTLITENDEASMIILDAKYYVPQLQKDKPVKAQPGIESVTKQYLYQLAYQDFVKKHGIKKVSNCFIMPTEEQDIISKGTVSMNMLDALGLAKIDVRLLPAVDVYTHYLEGSKFEMSRLQLTGD